MTEETARQAVREVAPWIEWTARLGFLSIGVVYIVAGLLTAAAAAGIGGEEADWGVALRKVSSLPFGGAALIVMAIGLLGYSLWLVCAAITDSDGDGAGAKGLAMRARNIASAVIHIALALAALRAVSGVRRASSDARATEWTARVMQLPFGRALTAIGGIAFIVYAGYALWRAWKARLGDQLHLEGAPARRLLIALARFGIAARGVVSGIIGASLISAAIHGNPQDTRATRGALDWINHAPYGNAILIAVSIGLAAYGVYAIMKAKYRVVRVT